MMQKVANLLESHYILHLAGGLFSAGRLWFMSKQNLIKILTVSSFILELSESVVTVSNCKTMKGTTGMMM